MRDETVRSLCGLYVRASSPFSTQPESVVPNRGISPPGRVWLWKLPGFDFDDIFKAIRVVGNRGMTSSSDEC